MALKHLVEGECGGSNPLMQWSSQFVHGKPATRVRPTQVRLFLRLFVLLFSLQGALHHDRLAELSVSVFNESAFQSAKCRK